MKGFIALLWAFRSVCMGAAGLNMPMLGSPLPHGRFEVVNHIPSQKTALLPNILGTKRAADFGLSEREALAEKFRDEFQPALDRWMRAYQGRIPFNATDVTLTNFVERVGTKPSFYLFTFVFNGVTLTFRSSQDTASVYYVALRDSVKALGEIPKDEVPDLRLPLSRQDVATMVKADTGVDFKPEQIFLTPTGMGSGMNGGAVVTIAPPNGNPAIGPSKLSMVFDSEGRLEYYLRDPFL